MSNNIEPIAEWMYGRPDPDNQGSFLLVCISSNMPHVVEKHLANGLRVCEEDDGELKPVEVEPTGLKRNYRKKATASAAPAPKAGGKG